MPFLLHLQFICFIDAVWHKVSNHKDMFVCHFDLFLLDTVHHSKYRIGCTNQIYFVFITFYIKIKISAAWI